VLNGGLVYIYDPASGVFNGNNLIFETGASWQSFYNGGASTPIESAVSLNGIAHFVVGDRFLNYSNVISGTGGFVLDDYNHGMSLSASNTYSGPTIIGSSGNSPEVALNGNGSISHSSIIFFGGNSPAVTHIDATGRSDQTLTLALGQTLQGIGGINGSLVASAGAIVSPGGTNTTLGITTGSNAVGTLAVSDNIALGGQTIIKLDGASNDVVAAGADLTYGGTLNLENISGLPLAAGNSFQIFSAAIYSGSFTSIAPATPGPGLAWNTSQLNSGLISVAGRPAITGPRLSGGKLIFSGSGGIPSGTYYLLASTNLLTPIANWTTIATNTYDASGNFNVTNGITAGNPQRFYIIKQP
jgi:hypothetical protein